MAFYRIGQFTSRITLERHYKRPDGAGGFEQLTQPLATCWAYVRPLSAKETQVADRTTANSQCVFVIRHRPDVRPSHVIVYQGERYNIRSLPEAQQRSGFLEIIAEKGV